MSKTSASVLQALHEEGEVSRPRDPRIGHPLAAANGLCLVRLGGALPDSACRRNRHNPVATPCTYHGGSVQPSASSTLAP